jgi:hypothetical protein
MTRRRKPTRARTEAERVLANEARRLRNRKLRRIRAKVFDGSYENPLKLSVAVDRLIERLSGTKL